MGQSDFDLSIADQAPNAPTLTGYDADIEECRRCRSGKGSETYERVLPVSDGLRLRSAI
jgi:hypothetical protein